jgi:hypothetical protein
VPLCPCATLTVAGLAVTAIVCAGPTLPPSSPQAAAKADSSASVV